MLKFFTKTNEFVRKWVQRMLAVLLELLPSFLHAAVRYRAWLEMRRQLNGQDTGTLQRD